MIDDKTSFQYLSLLVTMQIFVDFGNQMKNQNLVICLCN